MDSNLFFESHVDFLVSSKKCKELEVINSNENYLTGLITASL